MRSAAAAAFLGFAVAAQGADLPGWWRAFLAAPRLSSAFEQQSESAVFGSLTRKGQLSLARGGRIRVAYQPGLLLVADGKTLIQYDAGARTARRMPLLAAAKEAPLLWLLLDPAELDKVFQVAEADGAVRLQPRRPGLPAVTVQGRNGLPWRIQWTDPTGASQRLELRDPAVPAQAFPAARFSFAAPEGTRWLP